MQASQVVGIGQGLLPGLGCRQLLAVTAEHLGEHAKRADTARAAATAALRYALNLIRDVPPAAAPDADTAALLDRGCQILQASLTALQSTVADPHGTTYTRSASLFDLVEQRLAAPGEAAVGFIWPTVTSG